MIRPALPQDFEQIWSTINEASKAYKGIIPQDMWKEPYMSEEELKKEIDSGVIFYVFQSSEKVVGVAGIQPVEDTNLIRHTYVLSDHQRMGIGGELLRSLIDVAQTPEILVGTWGDATWAVSFYEKHGFYLVSSQEKNRLLRRYWDIPPRQVETSVVLKYKNQ